MPRNYGLRRTEVKSPYEAEVRNLDIWLIVIGGLVAAMCILWAFAEWRVS